MSRSFRTKKGPSQRQLRAGELIRHALVDILAREDLRDPALDGVSVTISEVRPSPDLRRATVFCAPLSGGANGSSTAEAKSAQPRDADAIVAALNRCAPFLRGRLGKHIETKFTPSLHFEPDRSFDEADAVRRLLERPEVRQDLQPEDD